MDSAVVLDIDRTARGFDNTANVLAASTDNGTDLIGLDADTGNARCVLGEIGARSIDRFGHFAEDVNPAFFGLIQRLGHDLFGNTGDFDIHLQGSNAFSGTGDFEVHVAEVIFVTKDVGKNCNVVAFFDQTHCNTGNRFLNRHTSIHQRERSAANRSH